MNLILKYVPPIKSSFVILVIISYFPLLLTLFLLFNQHGIISVLIFTIFYAILMVIIFLLLSKSYYLKILEGENRLLVHKGTKKINLDINQISEVSMTETKRSFILTITTKDKVKNFALSGSLSFEEPPFAPFLRKIEELKPIIVFDDYCHGILHGNTTFNPWSSKMYFAYWTYIIIMIAYYILLLVAIYILK